jgi:hypothetical protein
MLKKKIWANFQRIIERFTQKIFTKFSKIWVWDPGSGKNLFRIQGSKRRWIPDPDPQQCKILHNFWSNNLERSSGGVLRAGGAGHLQDPGQDPLQGLQQGQLADQLIHGNSLSFFATAESFLVAVLL